MRSSPALSANNLIYVLPSHSIRVGKIGAACPKKTGLSNSLSAGARKFGALVVAGLEVAFVRSVSDRIKRVGFFGVPPEIGNSIVIPNAVAMAALGSVRSLACKCPKNYRVGKAADKPAAQIVVEATHQVTTAKRGLLKNQTAIRFADFSVFGGFVPRKAGNLFPHTHTGNFNLSLGAK